MSERTVHATHATGQLEHAPSSLGDVLSVLRQIQERLDKNRVPEPEFATVVQAARRLGIGVKALRGAVQCGDLRVYHLGTRAGGRPRVHVPEIREWALGTACDPLEAARAAGDAAARRIAGERP